MKNESQLTTQDSSVLYKEWTKGTTANKMYKTWLGFSVNL